MSKVKISDEVVDLIRSATSVAAMLRIERVVIDNHSLRGQGADSTMLIHKFPDGTEHNFGSIGIGDIVALFKRFGVVEDGTIYADTKENDSGDPVARDIIINGRSKRTSITYRCTNPSLIRAPKAFRDVDMFSFKVSADEVKLMTSARGIMGGKMIEISADGESREVSFKITSDGTNDSIHHIFDSQLDELSDGDVSFGAAFKLECLQPFLRGILSLMKKESDGEIEITVTKRGVLKVDYRGTVGYLFPDKN